MDAAVDFLPQHGGFVLRGRGDAVALLAHVFGDEVELPPVVEYSAEAVLQPNGDARELRNAFWQLALPRAWDLSAQARSLQSTRDAAVEAEALLRLLVAAGEDLVVEPAVRDELVIALGWAETIDRGAVGALEDIVDFD